MRKATILSIFGLLAVVLAACAAPEAEAPAGPVADEFIADLGGREVTIMVENEYPPFNTLDPDTDEGIGWDYDAWRLICERLNCVPVFTEAAWPPFEMMAAGELDVAADGITIKMGRSQIIDYSDPYIEYGMIMMMRIDNIYGSADEFAASDARVASQAGTTNEAAALALVGEGRVDNYSEWPIAVEALLAGDADGVAIDDVAAVDWIKQNPDELMAGFALTSGEFLAFVFPPGSPLIGPVNQALQDVLNDGSLDAICQEWLLRDCSTTE